MYRLSLFIIGLFLMLSVIHEANAFDLCVGARSMYKLGYCKYEYEAYAYTGTCQARNGQWYGPANVTMTIRSPNWLNGHVVSGKRRVNFNDSVVGLPCRSACASARAEFPTGLVLTHSVCDRRSYE